MAEQKFTFLEILFSREWRLQQVLLCFWMGAYSYAEGRDALQT